MTLQAHSALGQPFGAALPVHVFDGAADAALVERSEIGCVLCVACVPPEAHDDAIAAAAGMPRPVPGTVAGGSRRRLGLWLSPRSWLILCPVADEWNLVRAFGDRFPDRAIHACCHTDHLCWLDLSGTDAEVLLRAGSFLSLAPGGLQIGRVRRSLLAGLDTVIYRCEGERWLLGVERSQAGHLVNWLVETARQRRAIRG